MAEVVGVVASGISIGTLAAQVASSIMKLKSLWNELRDAPADIEDLINEVEIINNMLLDLEEDGPSPVIGLEQQQSRSDCIRHCRAAANQMSLLVEDLASEIEKSKGLRRKIVSAKLVLRKDQVKKYKSRLKGTVRLLSLSEQCYTRAYQRRIHTILAQMSLGQGHLANYVTHPLIQQDRERNQLRKRQDAGDTAAGEVDAESMKMTPWEWHPHRSPTLLEQIFGKVHYAQLLDSSEPRNTYEYSNPRYKEGQRSYLRYTAPTWLANRVWEVCNTQARNTWTCNFRIYNVVPPDSLLFDFTLNGNLDAVKTLFSKGLASPFDRDGVLGQTALHVAVSQGNLALCQFLIEAGADPALPDFSLRTPFHHLSFQGGILAFARGLPVTDMTRLLLNGDVDVLTRDKNGNAALDTFYGPKDSLELLIRHANSSGLDMPLNVRVSAALYHSNGIWHNTPQLVRTVLGPGSIEHETARMIVKGGRTLVHGVMRALARCAIYGLRNFRDNYYDFGYWESTPPPEDQTGLTWAKMRFEWRAILAELLEAGAGLHTISYSGTTPFLEVLEELSRDLAVQARAYVFKRWLRDVRDAGVDLLQYGQNEARLHALGKCNRSLKGFNSPDIGFQPFDLGEYRLIGFTYGCDPSDWHLWISDPTDAFAGDFWRAIEAENRDLTIPGSWIE